MNDSALLGSQSIDWDTCKITAVAYPLELWTFTSAQIIASADEIERLRACETHDYRQIIEESDRYRTALETIANYSGNVEQALLLKYLAEAALKSSGETFPKHRFTAEAKEGYCIHCGRVMGEHSKGDLCCPETTGVTP